MHMCVSQSSRFRRMMQRLAPLVRQGDAAASGHRAQMRTSNTEHNHDEPHILTPRGHQVVFRQNELEQAPVHQDVDNLDRDTEHTPSQTESRPRSHPSLSGTIQKETEIHSRPTSVQTPTPASLKQLAVHHLCSCKQATYTHQPRKGPVGFSLYSTPKKTKPGSGEERPRNGNTAGPGMTTAP